MKSVRVMICLAFSYKIYKVNYFRQTNTSGITGTTHVRNRRKEEVIASLPPSSVRLLMLVVQPHKFSQQQPRARTPFLLSFTKECTNQSIFPLTESETHLIHNIIIMIRNKPNLTQQPPFFSSYHVLRLDHRIPRLRNLREERQPPADRRKCAIESFFVFECEGGRGVRVRVFVGEPEPAEGKERFALLEVVDRDREHAGGTLTYEDTQVKHIAGMGVERTHALRGTARNHH